MRKYIAIIVLWLTVSSCEYNNIEIKCYHGRVITSSCCTGTSFIEIDPAIPVGHSTKLNGRDYQNMIQVPGYLNEGEIYLELNPPDLKNDESLFPIHCYCLVAVAMDVPVWIATSYSYTTCPHSNND